jgi:hypothetical protein
VLVLGDVQYEDGTLSRYQESYDLSWGRLKSITRPAVGNHEYRTAGASGYFSYFGAAAGDKTKGYYSYDLGAWHLIALNSNCTYVGGCGVGSPQEQWLKADLAAHPNVCTLAYFHHPRFSSGQHGSDASYDVFWNSLYAAGVEVVLNGHDHIYERFAPQNPRGGADPNGIQQFIVGTGGKEHTSIASVQPNSAARNTDTFGFLKLTLHPTSYDWQFVPETGKTFTDSGSRNCIGASSSQPTADPTRTQTSNPPPTATAIPTNTPAATTTPSAPSSGNLTFTPVADVYVTSADPDTNYGTSRRIRLDANPVVNGYLTFNVQGVNAPIASVKLRIYVNSSSSQGFNVFGVPNTDWEEQSITFNNAPPLGSQIAASGSFQGDAWKKVDVTAYVTGNGTFGIALTGVNNTALNLASREAGSKAPQLIITTR